VQHLIKDAVRFLERCQRVGTPALPSQVWIQRRGPDVRDGAELKDALEVDCVDRVGIAQSESGCDLLTILRDDVDSASIPIQSEWRISIRDISV
jgi:hypothetical protein